MFGWTALQAIGTNANTMFNKVATTISIRRSTRTPRCVLTAAAELRSRPVVPVFQFERTLPPRTFLRGDGVAHGKRGIYCRIADLCWTDGLGGGRFESFSIDVFESG
jgi:hypothetical protein